MIARGRAQTLSNTFCIMRDQIVKEKVMREKSMRVVRRMAYQSSAKSFACWVAARVHAARHKVIKKRTMYSITKLCTLCLSKAIEGWRYNSISSRRVRTKSSKFISKRKRNCMKRTFASWLHKMKQHRRLQRLCRQSILRMKNLLSFRKFMIKD